MHRLISPTHTNRKRLFQPHQWRFHPSQQAYARRTRRMQYHHSPASDFSSHSIPFRGTVRAFSVARCRLACLFLRLSALQCPISFACSTPTTPPADFSTALNAGCPTFSAGLATSAPGRSPGVRHVSVAARAPDLQSASQPQMEGFAVTCPLALDAPRLISGFCSSPRSFGFGFGFLQTPSRGDALAVSLAFGSAKTWLSHFHRHSYVPCPAHTLC